MNNKFSKLITIIKWILNIGIINTLIFNIKYFGLKFYHFPVILGRHVEFKELKGKIICPNKFASVQIGISSIGIFADKVTYCTFQNTGNITFGNNVKLLLGVKISNHGNLTIADNTYINSNTTIVCYKAIYIGKNCAISWNNLIMDSDLHNIYDKNGTIQNTQMEIVIGNHCWLCANVTILKGVLLKNNVIVGANSCLTKGVFQENVIIKNNNVVKNNMAWKL